MPRPRAPIVVHSDLRPTGDFASSDERLNDLHELARQSLLGNACDIPTDCPQRERSGFTGDWQVFVDTAAMLYDVDGFSAKWLDDLAADQWADGRVPTVIPNPAGDGPSGIVFEDMSAGSAGWGDAAVLVPWELWRHYGDLDALRERLPSMRKWVEYAAGAAARVAASGSRFGAARGGTARGVPVGQRVPLRRVARARGAAAAGSDRGPQHRRDGVPAPLSAAARRERGAHRFPRARGIGHMVSPTVRARPGGPSSSPPLVASRSSHRRTTRVGSPSSCSTPTRAPLAAARLAELIADAGGHLGTGFLSTGQLLPVLADHGQTEVAYATLLSTGSPSWLGMLEQGATTAWEWWDAIGDDGAVRGSLNHYSKAAVVVFLYTARRRHPSRRGSADAAAAGFRRVRIAPVPGGGLTWARASIDTPGGPVRSEWRIDERVLTLEVELPDGTAASISLPDGTTRRVGRGIHSFTSVVPRKDQP